MVKMFIYSAIDHLHLAGPRYLTLGAHAREGYSSLCVCLSVCHATLYQATWYVYTLKVR